MRRTKCVCARQWQKKSVAEEGRLSWQQTIEIGGCAWWCWMVVGDGGLSYLPACLPAVLSACLPSCPPRRSRCGDLDLSYTHVLVAAAAASCRRPKSWAIERSGGRIDGQTVHPKVCWSVHPLAHCVSRCTHMIRVGILKYKRLSNTSRRALKFKHTQIYLILEASFELEIIRFLTI